MKKNYKKIIGLLLAAIFAIYYTYSNETTTSKNNSNINYKETEEVVNVTGEGNLKIYFIDVGQADSILIANNGEYALIDAGNNEDGAKLVEYFHGLGIKNFSYLIGTHAHEDHIGGMDNIIKNFNIGTFYMPDAITTTKTFEDVLDALEEKNISFQTPEIDSTFSMADCKFKVLYVGDDTTDLNDTSIVLKMTYGNNTFLFMGDATSKVESKLLNKNLKSDLLKVAHHGSNYSSTSAFLKKVNPKYAIIEVGVNNTYNHPKQSVINKLEDLGTKIYRTDEDGTIIATSNGTIITFETTKTNTNG